MIKLRRMVGMKDARISKEKMNNLRIIKEGSEMKNLKDSLTINPKINRENFT